MLDFSPGSIGCFGNSGTTQPHEEKADVINNGSEPAFTKKKLCSPFEFLAMVSKLNLFSSKEIMGPLSSWELTDTADETIIINIAIFYLFSYSSLAFNNSE